MVRYLQGPVSIYCWKVKDKVIWIFGDQHVVSEDCDKKKNKIYLQDLIKSELKRLEPEYIDLFLEHDFSTRLTKQKEITYMYKVSNTFRNCYMPRKKCIYNNLRVHAADRRRELEPLYYIIDLCHQLYSYIHAANSIEEKISILRTLNFDVEKTLQSFKDISQTCDDIDKCYTTLYDSLKIHKQLTKIEDKELVEFINSFFNLNNHHAFYLYHSVFDHHAFIKMKIKDIIKTFDKFFLGKNDKVGKLLVRVIEGVSATSDIFMDKYLIGRVFKKATGNNIIINAGFVHADTYNTFFNTLPYAKQVYKKEAARNKAVFSQCLRSTPQVLFTRS